MMLIVGLGNPGKELEHTRHNVGFMAIDKLAESFSFEKFKNETKMNTLISIGNINGKKVILAKPQTYMNNSGEAVQKIMDYYKISQNDLIVIQDELDIRIGNYKISKDRNSAGHKGAQSIIDYLGTKNFTRYRIGIDAERGEMPSDKFVLSDFSEAEFNSLDATLAEICSDIKERIKS